MTEQLMSHEEAVKGMAVERYLLGEMNEEQQAAFEAHYLSCAACLEAVTFAGEFMQAAEPVAREAKAAEQRSRTTVRERTTFLGKLSIVLRGPAPAWALVVILAGVLGYRSASRPTAIGPEARFVLTGISHGSSGIRQIRVSPNDIVSLGVEYGRSGQFLSYEARVLSSSGKPEFAIPLPQDQPGNVAFIGFRAGTLTAGEHSLVISGRNSEGASKDLGRGSFDLQFTTER